MVIDKPRYRIKGRRVISASSNPYPTLDKGNERYSEMVQALPNATYDSIHMPLHNDITNQSFNLWNTDSLARSIIETPIIQGLNTGINSKAVVKYKDLGLTVEEATALNRQINSLFNYHSNSLDIDYSRSMDFKKMQEVILREVSLNGCVGVLRKTRENKGGLRTCVQLISGSRISTPEEFEDDESVRNGVKIDIFSGEVLGYYIFDKEPKDEFFKEKDDKYTFVPARTKNGEQLFILVRKIELLNQLKGSVKLAPLLQSLTELNKLKGTELQQSVNSAQYGIIEHFDPETEPLIDDGIYDGESDFEDIDEEDKNKHTSKSKVDEVVNSLNRSGSDNKEKYAYSMKVPKGYKVESLAMNRPNVNFGPFYESMIKTIASSIGQPYEILMSHFSSSYSSSRSAFMVAKMLYKMIINDLVKQFVAPVREWCISECIATDLIKIPNKKEYFASKFVKSLYLNADYSPPFYEEIDAIKQAKKFGEYIKNGIVSRKWVRTQLDIDEQGQEDEILAEREIFGMPDQTRNIDKDLIIEDGDV